MSGGKTTARPVEITYCATSGDGTIFAHVAETNCNITHMLVEREEWERLTKKRFHTAEQIFKHCNVPEDALEEVEGE